LFLRPLSPDVPQDGESGLPGAQNAYRYLDDAFHDVFWFYYMGTVALWTGLFGVLATGALIVVSIPVQVGMNRLNGVALAQVNGVHVTARIGWLALAMVAVLAIVSLLRLSARVALAAGHQAGRQAEQVAVLRSMHDTVLQTLEAIALQARQPAAPQVRLLSIRAAHASTAGQGRVAGQRRPMASRVWVSGHWRNQPYGPGRALRRPVYIHPFLRGPQDGPITPSTTVRILGTPRPSGRPRPPDGGDQTH